MENVQDLPEAGWGDWLRWAARRRRRLRVTGDSMTPTLNDGDVVFVDMRAYRTGLPEPGDVVVALHPYQRDLRLIKRVGHITDDGRLFLVSDNPGAGTDSRAFGAIAGEGVLGRVVSRVIIR